MKIGVLGIGVIGSAIVEGLCMNGDDTHEIYISPRNELKSKTLSETFSQVTRCDSNQMVLNQAELIVLSVLPEKGFEVLRKLSFSENHHVINLMSDKKLEDIKRVIGSTKSLVHMVPLSFISRREGPIALFPPNDLIEGIFGKMGEIVALDDVKKIESIAAITGLMTSYYNLLNLVTAWGASHALSIEESKAYTTTFFEALSKHAYENNLETLSKEMTPGGLNELALNYINKKDGFTHWVDVLEPILKRLEK